MGGAVETWREVGLGVPIACPSCGASYTLGAAPPPTFTCRKCSTVMDLSAFGPAVPAPRASRFHDESDASALGPEERREAARELGKAMKFVRVLKDSYWAGAVLLALPLVVMLISGTFSWVALVLLALFAVFVLGILRLDRNPVPWSTFIAVVATALVGIPWLVTLATGARLRVGVDLLALVAVVGYWVAVGLATRVQRVVRRYPDLWMARRMRGDTIDDEIAGATTKHRDRVREEKRRGRRRLLLVGGVAAVAVAALLLFREREPEPPPPPPPPAVDVADFAERFRSAWNNGSVAAIEGHFQPSSRDRFSRTLGKILERRGWTEQRPALGSPHYVREDQFAAAHFPLPDGAGMLYTSWAYDASTQAWGINALRFPREE